MHGYGVIEAFYLFVKTTPRSEVRVFGWGKYCHIVKNVSNLSFLLFFHSHCRSTKCIVFFFIMSSFFKLRNHYPWNRVHSFYFDKYDHIVNMYFLRSFELLGWIIADRGKQSGSWLKILCSKLKLEMQISDSLTGPLKGYGTQVTANASGFLSFQFFLKSIQSKRLNLRGCFLG